MRLVDADALIEKMLRDGDTYTNDDIRHGYHNCQILVYEAPIVDAEPIRHGHWIGIDDEPCEVFECDKCGYITEEIGCADNKPNNFNYCPRCGALMDEVENNGEMDKT